MNEDNIIGFEQTASDPDHKLDNPSQMLRLTLYPSSAHEDPHPADMPDGQILTASTTRTYSLPKLLTRSLLPYCVLYLLSTEPHYGNEILSWLRQRAGLWAASPGTVYPLLQQLESDGLIRGRWEPGIKRPRHVYEITEAGRDTVKDLRITLLPQLELSLRLLSQLLEELQGAEN